MSRRIELWVSIQELNEQGEYASVELQPVKDISTGGVFQLRQVRGRTRRELDASNAELIVTFVLAGSFQEAAGVGEAGPELGNAASAGGGHSLCVYRLRVGSLHQTAEASRQLPGLRNIQSHRYTRREICKGLTTDTCPGTASSHCVRNIMLR